MSENMEAISRLFNRLHVEFPNAERIVQVIVEEVGSCRVTFPDLKDLHKMARDRCIIREFNGFNLVELGFRYGLHPRQVRRIISAQK